MQKRWKISHETNGMYIRNEIGGLVAKLEAGYQQTRNEHAKLIATAPDLLVTLQECVTYDGAIAERSHTEALRRLRAINEIVKAAIAKATN